MLIKPAALAVATFVAPSLSVRPIIGAGPAALPTPALTATFAAPSIAPALGAPTPALAVANTLGSALTAASANGQDAAPALSAAFDGLQAGSSEDSVPVSAASAATPESFALQAESMFTAGRLPAGKRAAVAWRDGVRPEGVEPTQEEMLERMRRSPLTNAEREAVVKELFRLGGAAPDEIITQDAGKGRNNVMVVKKGKTDRVIVVGGHYDLAGHGSQGVIDNWTGTTLVTNLHQALRGVETDATIVFIAFAREEEGLIGSAKYVASLTPAQRSKIDAMINLDTLAVNGTFSWRNNSTRALLDRLAQSSRESGHALTEATLWGGDADSSSFRRARIPAVTIFGASEDVIFDIIHSERDNMAAFNLGHYANAFKVSLAAIKALDARPLGPVPGREI